jgi:hypothetical protein
MMRKGFHPVVNQNRTFFELLNYGLAKHIHNMSFLKYIEICDNIEASVDGKAKSNKKPKHQNTLLYRFAKKRGERKAIGGVAQDTCEEK